jgi:uncharacterized protein
MDNAEWTMPNGQPASCYNDGMSNPKVSIEQAREFYAGADSAHDFEHILRVMRMAERLALAEGGDVEVVRAAALLHDIARHAEDTERKNGESHESALDHAQVSAEDARAFLMENGAEASFAEQVAVAIRSHRFRGTLQPTTLEGKILFDADKLDAIGAIGVARAYAICGLSNQKLYSEPRENAVAARSQHNEEHTPVDEYHVKLKHLQERFFTPAAQKIAAGRDAFMRGYFEQLTREVSGEL